MSFRYGQERKPKIAQYEKCKKHTQTLPSSIINWKFKENGADMQKQSAAIVMSW